MRAIRPKKAETKVAKPAPVKKKAKRVAKPVSLKPRVSEKAYGLSESVNTYVFDVESNVNKLDVAQSVAAQYEVSVTSVRLATVPGKAVRTYRQKGRRSISGKRPDLRKAYVTLAAGDKLPIFAAVEEPQAPKETK